MVNSMSFPIFGEGRLSSSGTACSAVATPLRIGGSSAADSQDFSRLPVSWNRACSQLYGLRPLWKNKQEGLRGEGFWV